MRCQRRILEIAGRTLYALIDVCKPSVITTIICQRRLRRFFHIDRFPDCTGILPSKLFFSPSLISVDGFYGGRLAMIWRRDLQQLGFITSLLTPNFPQSVTHLCRYLQSVRCDRRYFSRLWVMMVYVIAPSSA